MDIDSIHAQRTTGVCSTVHLSCFAVRQQGQEKLGVRDEVVESMSQLQRNATNVKLASGSVEYAGHAS